MFGALAVVVAGLVVPNAWADVTVTHELIADWIDKPTVPIDAGDEVQGYIDVNTNDLDFGQDGTDTVTVVITPQGGSFVSVPKACAAGSAVDTATGALTCVLKDEFLGSVIRVAFALRANGANVASTMSATAAIPSLPEVAPVPLSPIDVNPALAGVDTIVEPGWWRLGCTNMGFALRWAFAIAVPVGNYSGLKTRADSLL